jgi:hypothetical protein
MALHAPSPPPVENLQNVELYEEWSGSRTVARRSHRELEMRARRPAQSAVQRITNAAFANSTAQEVSSSEAIAEFVLGASGTGGVGRRAWRKTLRIFF